MVISYNVLPLYLYRGPELRRSEKEKNVTQRRSPRRDVANPRNQPPPKSRKVITNLRTASALTLNVPPLLKFSCVVARTISTRAHATLRCRAHAALPPSAASSYTGF